MELNIRNSHRLGDTLKIAHERDGVNTISVVLAFACCGIVFE